MAVIARRQLSGEINRGFSEVSLDTIHVTPPPPPPQMQAASPLAPPPAPAGSRPRKNRTVVHVENANKIYGTGDKARHVLKDLCMAVEEHTIYGLLGASGCGKTTILSCIVALRKLCSGSILVCGQETGTVQSGVPGKKVGYMPQEIAVNGEFTIVEVLAYFGRIYGMSRPEIRRRTAHLMALLDLDGVEDRIDNLSDGQKRRVSMAVAMVHQPAILILDEPTVGLDPLLRDNIWVYLHDLVARSSTTIIVTTHYIEEMRQADRVGIMRSGRLLCEDSPSQLLQIYNENLLDAVVVKLCKQDEKPHVSGVLGPFDLGNLHAAAARDQSAPSVDVDLTESTRRRTTTAGEVRAEWGAGGPALTTSVRDRMFGLLVKDFLVMFRNWFFSLIVVFLPAIAVSIYGIVLDSDPNGLKLGVVNFETDACPSIAMNSSMLANGCFTTHLSCVYINSLDPKVVKLVSFDTLEDAEDAALKTDTFGHIWFEPNFTQHFVKRVVANDMSDKSTLDLSNVNVRLDMTEYEVGYFLRKMLTETLQELSRQLLTSCGVDPATRNSPVEFGEPIFSFGSKKDTQPIGFMATGVTLAYVFFFCAIQCGLTFIIEQKDGMLNRTMVSGVSKLEIMLSHLIVQIFVSIFQTLACFLLIFVIFDVESRGSIPLGFGLVIMSSIVGMSLGFVLASFVRDEKDSMLIAMGFWFPNFLLAGIFWPLESLPLALQYIGLVLPCTIIGEGFKSIVCRGMGLGDQIVWMGFVTSGAWFFGCWLIIFMKHRFGSGKE